MRLLYILFSVLFISGCASYTPTISQEAEEELAKPIDCSTAAGDIRILENEKVSCMQQAESGIKMIIPAAAARGILHRDYLNRGEVATGQYNRDIEAKIKQIKDTCGME